jgi:predicted transcriptional regulator
MNSLPPSIESYLVEAGFSSTEILVLKKILEEDAVTLRQLAAKTGKSTGVLDQALKKLVRRSIVTKEWINDSYKYTLISLQAIAAWMEQDMTAKQEMMKRRHQNFESFIKSIEVGKHRPDMQYFEGTEGIEQAYTNLLDHGKELLHFFPVVCAVEDDPMRDFRVQHFRDRRKRGIFARYIVHNTPLGRRFATRDPFEYRKTLLIPENRYPITFEKVIADDLVACINHVEKRACFLRFPELADTERLIFNQLWKEQEDAAKASGPTVATVSTAAPAAPQVPLSTRTLSTVREFFVSKKSLVMFGMFALVAAAVTYGLYRQNVYLNTQRIQERAIAIASTAAGEFDPKDFELLHTESDANRPEFQKLVTQLREIKQRNANILFAYIDRPTGMKATPWEVIADADFGTPDKDWNGNGIIESSEQLTKPGQKYPHEDPSVEERMRIPFTELVRDEWGTYYDASAPIFDSQGKPVAALFVDISFQEMQNLSRQTFAWGLYFLGFFLLFVFIRLAAFNRSLFFELLSLCKSRRVVVVVALCAELAFFVTLGMYYYTLSIMKTELGNKLMAIAATAAPEFSAEDLNQLHWAKDMKTEAYQRVFQKLNEIRKSSENIKYVYIFRPTSIPMIWEFIADANSNYNIPYWEDFNNDGKIQSDELNIFPGARYASSLSGESIMQEQMKKPAADTDFYTDQWGTYLSAGAPIFDEDHHSVGFVGLDMDISDIYRATTNRYTFSLWFISCFVGLLSAHLILLRVSSQKRSPKLISSDRSVGN